MLEFLVVCDLGDATATNTVLTALYYVRLVIKILQIAVPVGLILFGTLDMAKAVIAGDEKKIKEAQKPFVKRIIAAVIAFLVPWIVTAVVGFVTNSTTYRGCWDKAKTKPITNFDVMKP